MFDSTFIWKLPKWHAIPSLLQNRLKEWKWLKEREGEEEKEWLNVSTWLVIWPNYLCLVAQSLACSIATHYACQLSAVHECTMLSLCVCVCVCVCVIQQSLIGRSDIVPPPLHPTVSSFTIWCASVGWESPNALARLHHHRYPLKQCICTSSMPAENHLLIFDTYTFLCAPIKYLLPVSAPGISSLSMPVTIDQGRISQKHSCAVKFMRSGQHGALQKTLKRLTCIHLKIVLTSFIIYSCLCQSIYDILWRDLFCPQRHMQWKLMWSNLFWLSLYG